MDCMLCIFMLLMLYGILCAIQTFNVDWKEINQSLFACLIKWNLIYFVLSIGMCF